MLSYLVAFIVLITGNSNLSRQQSVSSTGEPKRATNIVWKTRLSDGIQKATIPLYHDPVLWEYVFVKARVNGSKPLLLVFDTGFSGDITLTEKAAAELGLTPDSKTQASIKTPTGSGKTSTLPLEQFTLQGKTDQDNINIDVAQALLATGNIADDFTRRNIAGMVGLGPFSRNEGILQIDFVNDMLNFTFDTDYRPSSGEGIALLPLTEGMVSNARVLVPISLGDKKTMAVMDTGASATTLKMATRNFKKVDERQSLEMLGTSTAWDCEVNSLTVGTRTFSPVVVFVQPKAESSLLGNDILSNFLVTFDFIHHNLILESPPALSPRQRQCAAWCAWVERRPDGRLYVGVTDAALLPPPTTGGAVPQVGDEILTLDGNAVNGLDTLEAQHALDGIAGTVAHLTVRRANEVAEVSFVRPYKQPNGRRERPVKLRFAFHRTKDDKFVFDSDCEFAGTNSRIRLHKGDELLSLNDILPHDLTPEMAQRIVRHEVIILTVRDKSTQQVTTYRLFRAQLTPIASADLVAPVHPPVNRQSTGGPGNLYQ